MAASKEFNPNLSILELSQKNQSHKEQLFLKLALLNTGALLILSLIAFVQASLFLGIALAISASLHLAFGLIAWKAKAKHLIFSLLLSIFSLTLLLSFPLTGGLFSPLLPLLVLVLFDLSVLYSRPSNLIAALLLFLGVALILSLDFYFPDTLRAFELSDWEGLYAWNAPVLGLFFLVAYFLILGQNSQIEDKTGKVFREVREENSQLKKEIRQLNSRNLRLVKMYENLNQLEQTNEKKTEIMTEVARVLDHKHKTILTLRDKFETQSQLLEEINENITNSIRYAQKIQEAIIPEAEWVSEHFRDSFIYFKPKDIVSGDFYWFEVREVLGKKMKILIAADCTGHGVPGAFMTVMGNSLINEIVLETSIIQPDWLLQELDRKVRQTLSNRKGETQIHDGMDMVCLVIDEESNTVQYAAAHNPLYYVSDQKFHQIKGSRYSVGSSQYRSNKEFKLHTIKAKPGDVFYIFTDGFQDQFGEKAQRKYMTRRYREFLLSISRLPLGKQLKVIDSEFQSWKGGFPQTDDVLVIGFRI